LCDELGIEHPIVLGASFGGFVAQRYIARHPEHPAKVILACTATRLDLDVIEAAFTRFGSEAAGATARKPFPRLRAPLVVSAKTLRAREPRKALHPLLDLAN
jgi:pimeloyl-ACP methyl ester carboxylesterase